MRTININKDESGIAHLGLILLVVAVVGVVGVGYWRVSSTKKSQSHLTDTTEQTQALPQNLQDLKTLDEIGQIAGVTDSTSIIKFVLESKDGGYVYKVILSNGKKLVIDASTGKVLSEETTDVSEDDKIPAGVQVTVSPADAYRIAAQKSSSPIKSIEMEVEDKKVVYKIEYRDGSKIEINAVGGAVIKSEIKDESEQENESEDREDEQKQEDEDHSNEDSDDSRDSEDHEEEDR